MMSPAQLKDMQSRASVKYSYLRTVAIGEAAIVGAGIGVALIGAAEITTAVTAQQWLVEAKHYIDYAPLVGSAVGVITRGLRIARRGRWAAAKMVGVSDHVVARGGARLEETSQIAKLDETIDVNGNARPARKSSANVIPLPMQGQPQEAVAKVSR